MAIRARKPIQTAVSFLIMYTLFLRKALIIKNVFIITGIILLVFSCKEEKSNYKPIEKKVFASTKKIPDSLFVGDQKCATCHKEELKNWQGSHHDKSMQIATRETILASFNGEQFYSQGVESRFFQKDSAFYVNTEGSDGKNHDYKIEYVFGITPLQQYIVKFPNGHYQCLRTAWDTKKNQWFDLYPDFKVVHSEWLHWSRGGLNWNNMCADCHSTNVRKNYSQKNHSYNTKFALINVSCEACHGPGKQHISDVTTLGKAYKNSGTMQMTLKTPPKELVDQCARCHIRREQISEYFNFEGTLLDHYYPQLLETPIYHPDGQILDEDYVYGSFIQSKMYHNDVTCTNCHDAHSLKLRFKGNKLCAQCHIPETYDTEKHHFHTKDTEGAQCINCHMPGKYYMGNDFRRDHSFRIPRPDLSIKYGTPNACTTCHKDKNNAWAEKHFLKQYGKPDYNHFSDLLAPGLTDAPNGIEVLQKLAKDTIYPDIARASAIKKLGSYRNPINIDQLLAFLNDSSPLVRASTVDALNEISNPDYLKHIYPLLEDSKRAVRVKTFNALAALKEHNIPETYKLSYNKAKKEYATYLKTNADFVGGRINRANYLLKKGHTQKAIEGYESALEIDPTNNIVRTNLSNLYYQNKNFEKAESAFKTIIAQEPDYGPTYYSYGLLLAELKKYKDAITQMELAVKHMPENIRVYYNLSLLYDNIKNPELAEKTIIKGLKQDHNNEQLLYLLAFHYSKNSEMEKARNIALKLVELYPGNTQYNQFLQQLKK